MATGQRRCGKWRRWSARERNEPPIVRTLWRVDRSGDPTETILANGMPLVEMPMPGRLATTIAIAFPAGARHEAAA